MGGAGGQSGPHRGRPHQESPSQDEAGTARARPDRDPPWLGLFLKGRLVKIRSRIILSFVVLVGIGFYFLVHHILAELRPRYLEAVEEVLVDEANLLAAFLESQMTDGKIPAEALRGAFQDLAGRSLSAQIYKLHKTRVDERVYVTDGQGRVIFDSEGRDEGKDFSQWRDVALTLRGEYGARTTRDEAGDPTTSILHVAAPIRYQGR